MSSQKVSKRCCCTSWQYSLSKPFSTEILSKGPRARVSTAEEVFDPWTLDCVLSSVSWPVALSWGSLYSSGRIRHRYRGKAVRVQRTKKFRTCALTCTTHTCMAKRKWFEAKLSGKPSRVKVSPAKACSSQEEKSYSDRDPTERWKVRSWLVYPSRVWKNE